MVAIFVFIFSKFAKHLAYRNIPDCTVYTGTKHIGLLFTSSPNGSDVRIAYRIAAALCEQWRSQPDNLVPLCKFHIIIIIHFLTKMAALLCVNSTSNPV